MVPSLIIVYTLSIVCFQVAIHSPLRSLWIIQLINTVGVWLYLPLSVFLPLALLKSKRVAILLLIPTLIFALEYYWSFLPQWISVSHQPTLRVMTWNVWYKNPDPIAVRDTILAQKPDIVALQELVDSMSDPLQEQLRAVYPYQSIGRSAALGIFSRYPLEAVRDTNAEVKACRCQNVIVSWPDQPSVRLINAHLPTPTFQASRWGAIPIITAFNSSKQDRWLNVLMQQIDSKEPLLVVGDFNIGDRQPNYQRLRAQLDDAFFEVGWGLGLSYPVNRWTRFPLFRIDYIFHNPDWNALQASINKGAGSDHKYVIANLQLHA
jgi:endonuclease/exonuclease/phosphatase (EEP) superfamily protein YafD